MTRAILLIILALAASTADAQVRTNVTLHLDGSDRYFIVQKPSGSVPSGGYPVVFMFHGTSGDGEKFYDISGWKEKGEQEKFITVFPSSLEYCVEEDGERKRTTKWNNGDLQTVACAGQTLKDDVRFVRRMIDTIALEYRIDRNRIYAAGFSNGALFTSKLAVEMSDVFAAIAASAGSLHSLDSGRAIRSIPFAFSIGIEDDRLLTALGMSELPFNDTAFAYLRVIFARYLAAFGLTDDYSYSETPLTITRQYTTALPGTTAASFTATFIKNLGHQFPNGTNHALTAANSLWEFFKRNTLVSSIDIERGRHQSRPHPRILNLE